MYDADERYSPRGLVEKLGVFDLDPCAAEDRRWWLAETNISKSQDGLALDWGSQRVWLNPPYENQYEEFIRRFIDHKNGVSLLPNKFESRVFQELVLPNAVAIKMLVGRTQFFRPDGSRMYSRFGHCLVAVDEENAKILESSDIRGWCLTQKLRR